MPGIAGTPPPAEPATRRSRRLVSVWLLPASVAALAALPGLRFPFLSDDWLLVESVGAGALPAAPYEYFRPLYMATFWLDRWIWGPSPAFFHLTNLLLIAACAALVACVAARYTGDTRLALLAGVLFALHPYHVENAAWIAVRGDPLYGALLLMAALAYERWRSRLPLEAGARFFAAPPLAALILFGAALMAKESAVVFPLVLAILAFLSRGLRAMRREWLPGFLPLLLLAALHFLIVRPLFLPGGGRSLAPGSWLGWLRNIPAFCVAAVVPVDGEWLAASPALWGSVAAASALVLAGVTLVASRRSEGAASPGPSAAWAARISIRFTLGGAALFGALLLPSVIGFQERYLFLPAAAAAAVLAHWILAAGRRRSPILGAAVMAGWSLAIAHHWTNWNQAAVASRSLVAGLAAASCREGVEEIVVANMPFRVRGGSVAGDFRAALALAGGCPVPVRAVTFVSYPDARTTALDRSADPPILVSPALAEVALAVEPGPFSRLVAPQLTAAARRRVESFGSVEIESRGRLRVTIPSLPGNRRAAFVWSEGSLVPLF